MKVDGISMKDLSMGPGFERVGLIFVEPFVRPTNSGHLPWGEPHRICIPRLKHTVDKRRHQEKLKFLDLGQECAACA